MQGISKMTLYDLQCRTAQKKSKKYRLTDGQGLYLEVMPNGSKYWRLKYRFFGKEKRIALGVYPKVSLLQARQLQNAYKEDIKNGIDPVLARREQKQITNLKNNQTFEMIAHEWHGKNSPVWDVKYAQTILHRLEKYVFPYLGTFPINSIKSVVVLNCLQQIEKTAPDMARRIKQIIRSVFKYAIATGRIEYDPTYGIEEALQKYKKGHFVALSVDELPKFLIDFFEYRANLKRQTFLAINLMMLTFVRTSELIQASWTEIDFENAMWIIPPERMKMRSPHMVPLSKQSLKILTELKDLNGMNKYVFPSLARPKKTMSKGTILVALKRMGYKNRMTGHGFRSLALGILKEKLKYSHEIADRQLAHVPKNSTDRAYDRAQFLPDRIEMMQYYADYLDDEYIKALIASRNKDKDKTYCNQMASN